MKNKNIYSTIIIWFSTLLAWVLSYLYHPVMVRYLDIKEFAEFESLLWVINLFTVFVSAIALFFVKEFSRMNDENSEVALAKFLKKIWFIFWILFFLVYIVFSPFIYIFLKIENYFIVLFIWVTLFIAVLSIYPGVVFQSKTRFSVISVFNILWPILRLLFWIIFIFLWFKVFWVIWWFIISQIILLFVGDYLVNRILQINKKMDKNTYLSIKNKIKKHFFKQKHQIFHFTLSSILLAVFMYIDILFAKHFFSAEIAWIYSWISVIAKFLVTIGMSIETVYYPPIVSENKIDKKKFSLLSLLYVLMTIWAIWFFYLFWEKILHLFKPWFEEYLNLLYLIIIYCWILSLLNFLVKILIAFEKYFINYIILAVTGIFIWILYLFVDNSVYNLINIFNLMIFVSLFAWFVYFFMIKDEK